MSDSYFGIGILLFSITALFFALHARRKGCQTPADYIRTMAQTDATARFLGALQLLMAISFGFVTAWLPYWEARQHAEHVLFSVGAIGAAALLMILGSTYLILGSRATRLIPMDRDPRNYTIAQWLYLAFGMAAMVGIVIEYPRLLERLGYIISRW